MASALRDFSEGVVDSWRGLTSADVARHKTCQTRALCVGTDLLRLRARVKAARQSAQSAGRSPVARFGRSASRRTLEAVSLTELSGVVTATRGVEDSECERLKNSVPEVSFCFLNPSSASGLGSAGGASQQAGDLESFLEAVQERGNPPRIARGHGGKHLVSELF